MTDHEAPRSLTTTLAATLRRHRRGLLGFAGEEVTPTDLDETGPRPLEEPRSPTIH